jgi:phosphate uptake regulator
MKRKVIKLAEKTFVVSLPSEWVKKYGIQKSDELEVLQKHNTLHISTPANINIPARTTVDISGLSEDFVKSIVSVLHKVGYDEIEFFYDDPKILTALHRRTAQLIGFEVIEQTPRRCVIKNVSGDLSHELDNMVRRTFLVTTSLAKGSFDLLSGNADLSSLLELEKTNNRLTNYCHRLLNKQSRGSHTIFLYTVLWVLESIADEYRDVCKAINQDGAISPMLQDVFLKVNNHLESYYHFFYAKDHAKMDELRSENRELKAALANYAPSQKEAQVASHLFAVVQRVYDCFGSTTGKKFLEQHVKDA